LVDFLTFGGGKIYLKRVLGRGGGGKNEMKKLRVISREDLMLKKKELLLAIWLRVVWGKFLSPEGVRATKRESKKFKRTRGYRLGPSF